MQNTLNLVKDVRGCMTRFDPLTPEIVAAQTEDGLTYDKLKEVLEECGMDIHKVVFDGSRTFQNAFYADFEQGHYCWIPFQKKGLKDVIRTMDQQFHSENFGLSRKNHEWTTFYMMDVPLPMQIYDFERRYKDIEPEQVFDVWSSIHTHIDYANGMWKPEVLEYVFSHAPQTEMPETDEDGLITIYRGMGEMSQDPANAISWSTDPVCALWFANRSGRGTRLVSAKVTPEQILVYNPGYRAEHEVILKPGVRPIFQYADMIPSTEGHVPRLLAPVTKAFFRYGSIAVTLGYPKEGLFMYHGVKHILRVLLLTLIYCEHSCVSLSEEDKQILIYFSLLHDIGRDSEDEDDIIDKALWNRVQKKISTHARPLTPTGMVHPFSGIVVCMHCGYAVRPHKTHGHYYLMCNTRQISEDACPGAFIPAEELERIVISELRKINKHLLDLTKLEREIEFEESLNAKKAKIQSEQKGYQEKIDEYTTALQTLYIDKSKGLISIRDYYEMAEAFQKEKNRFEQMVQACQDKIEDLDTRIQIGDNRTELLAKYLDTDHLTRSMTEILIDHIEIGKRSLETGAVPVSIFWNF